MTSAGSSPRAYAPASHLVASQTERRGKFEQVVVQELEIGRPLCSGCPRCFCRPASGTL